MKYESVYFVQYDMLWLSSQILYISHAGVKDLIGIGISRV